MSKFMLVEVADDFVIGGRMRFKAVDTRLMKPAKVITPDEAQGPWFKALYEKGSAKLFAVSETTISKGEKHNANRTDTEQRTVQEEHS